MSSNTDTIRELAQQEYKWGFVTNVDEDRAPKGLNEDIIRLISAKKNEPDFMLEWRLKAYRHWETLQKSDAEPKWANIHYGPIDYQENRPRRVGFARRSCLSPGKDVARGITRGVRKLVA